MFLYLYVGHLGIWKRALGFVEETSTKFKGLLTGIKHFKLNCEKQSFQFSFSWKWQSQTQTYLIENKSIQCGSIAICGSNAIFLKSFKNFYMVVEILVAI